MAEVTITPIYAAALAILMAVLSTRVGILRGKHSVALGTGEVRQLSLGIRRFGNLAEYAAMAVVILLLLEIRGLPAPWLHAYGIILLMCRLIHPVILFDDMSAPLWKKVGRFVAAAGTAMLLMVGAIVLLIAAI